MKKGSFSKLASILLIFIIVLISILGGGKLLWNAGKAGLSLFGLINITEVDYSQLNTDAKSSFETLIKDIEACKNSQDDNCLCYTSLSGYNKIHQFEIDNKEIKLFNIKDGNSITMNKKEINNFNCYYDDSGLNAQDSLIINFDEDLPAIKTGFFSQNVNFFKNPALYKSSKLCLVSTKFDLSKVNKICALKQ